MTESADEPLFPATDPIAPGASPPPTATAAADAGVPDRPARPRRPAAKRPALDADVDADADAEGVTRAAVDAAPDSIEADALAAPAASMPMALDPPHAERPTEAPTAPTRRRRGASKGPSEVFAPVSPPDTDAAAEATDATDATAAAADVPDTAVSMSSVASRDLSEADVDDTMAAGATPDTRQLTPTPPAPQEPPLQVGDLFAQVLSGAFDVSAEPPPDAAATPPKRVLLPEPEAPKLHKVLAQAGVGSRRDMEQMIADGLVTVNGQPAHTGQRISFGDRIAVDGKPVKVRIQPLPARLIAYHKPAGEVVSHDDPQQRPTVFRRLPRLQQGKWQSVGRLDLNTEGLLLFTNNGQLANQLMHPRFGVEREYAVRLHGQVDPAASAKLLEGVELDGQACSFRSIEDGGGDGANHWYRVVITEGRNREVRRLFEAVGLTVSRLIRIRYGSVVLPRGLKRGVWVDLSDTDLRAVRQLVAAGQRQGGEAGQAPAERTPGEPRPPRPQQEPRPRRDGREPRPPYQPQGQQPPRGNGPRPGPGPRPPAVSFDHIDRPVPFDDDVDPDFEEEIDHARIPNPLEQTFDKRFVQNPRGPAGGRGFGQGGGGFGAGGSAPRGGGAPGGRKGPGAPREPDPMQTSVGYIGGDAFLRKANRGNGGGGSGGNRGGGGGGPRGGNGGPRGGGGGGGGGFRGR